MRADRVWSIRRRLDEEVLLVIVDVDRVLEVLPTVDEGRNLRSCFFVSLFQALGALADC